MSLSVGIVGLPNAGKSTLFNALVGRQIAEVAERPFTTIEPNVGIVSIPDENLVKLSGMVKPNETVPASIKFIDIAGLVKGAHQGEGLGNKFLSHIREVDAILHLVRDFSNPSVTRVEGSTDPLADIQTINLELILADFEVVARNLDDLEKKARQDPQLKKQAEVLKRIKQVLGEGRLASELGLDEEEKERIKDYNLLTLKPVIYVFNTDEQSKPKNNLTEKFPAIGICAALESDLNELEPADREEYLTELGQTQSGLDRLVQAAYRLLDLITFYTIKGGKEAHAWPIGQGATALEAAAMVHSDMAKGFIKAEVISVQDLLIVGSWEEARNKGKLRLEGKDYLVKDGEVLEFRFSKFS